MAVWTAEDVPPGVVLDVVVEVLVLGRCRARRRRTGCRRARSRRDRGLERRLVGLNLRDLSLGQPHARQDGRLVRLDLRLGRGPAQRPLADGVQRIFKRTDRRVRGLSTGGNVVIEVGLQSLQGRLDRLSTTSHWAKAASLSATGTSSSGAVKRRIGFDIPPPKPNDPPPNIPSCLPAPNKLISAAREPLNPISPRATRTAQQGPLFQTPHTLPRLSSRVDGGVAERRRSNRFNIPCMDSSSLTKHFSLKLSSHNWFAIKAANRQERQLGHFY